MAMTLRLFGSVRSGQPRGGDRRLAACIFAAFLALAGLVLTGQAAFIHVKAVVAQILLERAFAKTVQTGGGAVKPWSWADVWPVARVEIPRLKARAIVLSGSSGQALAFGPGHVEGTPEPGHRGWAVYAAHRDTHFAFLKNVELGDEVVVTRADGERTRFEVKGMRIARWDRTGIDASAAGRGLVLATCWPLEARGRGPLRYLVFAEAMEGLEP